MTEDFKEVLLQRRQKLLELYQNNLSIATDANWSTICKIDCIDEHIKKLEEYEE